MAKIRLDKYITSCGAYTRSQAKKLIHAKKVCIDGIPLTDEGFKVNEQAENITINGISAVSEKYIYIMLNKPAGVISSTADNTHKTVLDLIAPNDRRSGLFPAGRLDIDTLGLIILTNDGVFAHNALSPKKHVPKLYAADVSGYSYTEDSRQRFLHGITLSDGYICKPAELSLVAEHSGYTSVTLKITEGKFHQVKKMFEAEGGKVISLTRLSFGDITLDPALKSGEYRRLTAEEMEFVAKIRTPIIAFKQNGEKE